MGLFAGADPSMMKSISAVSKPVNSGRSMSRTASSANSIFKQILVPAGEFGEAVVGDAVGAFVRLTEVSQTDGRNHRHAEAAGGFQAPVTGDHLAGRVDQDRADEAEATEAPHDLVDLLVVMGPRIAERRRQLCDGLLGDVEIEDREGIGERGSSQPALRGLEVGRRPLPAANGDIHGMTPLGWPPDSHPRSPTSPSQGAFGVRTMAEPRSEDRGPSGGRCGSTATGCGRSTCQEARSENLRNQPM